MSAVYRIPLAIPPGGICQIDDLDMPLMLAHSRETTPFAVHLLSAHSTTADRPLLVQCLRSPAPSAVRGHHCWTLLIDCRTGWPGASENVDLLVGATTPTRQMEAAAALVKGIMLVKAEDAVTIKDTSDTLEVTLTERPFLTYHYNTKDRDTPRPYFHPVIGPTGKPITQMGEVPGKREKHFHHTALWIAHQNFAARGEPPCDNWQIGRPNSSRIEHVKFDRIESGPLAGRFIEQLRWLNVKGDKTLLAETRTMTMPRRPAAQRVLDIDIVLTGQDVPMTLNKTPYHILAARVLDAMLPKNGGAITNSDGKTNPPDGTPAKWIDISGKLDGDEQGIALFNHPDNFRQPTPCLQFAGQTIGLSPTHKEAYTIEPGKQLRLRYRVLVHAGTVADKVAAEYEAYGKGGQTRVGGPERLRG